MDRVPPKREPKKKLWTKKKKIIKFCRRENYTRTEVEIKFSQTHRRHRRRRILSFSSLALTIAWPLLILCCHPQNLFSSFWLTQSNMQYASVMRWSVFSHSLSFFLSFCWYYRLCARATAHYVMWANCLLFNWIHFLLLSLLLCVARASTLRTQEKKKKREQILANDFAFFFFL